MKFMRGQFQQSDCRTESRANLIVLMNQNTSVARRPQIRRAKQFLLNPYYSIEEIAIELGFGSTEEFCGAFDAIVGESPDRYQSRIRAAMDQIALGSGVVRTLEFTVEDSTEFELACAAA